MMVVDWALERALELWVLVVIVQEVVDLDHLGMTDDLRCWEN